MRSDDQKEDMNQLNNIGHYNSKKVKMKPIVDVDAVNIPPLLRNVVYICMSPKMKVADKSVIRQRIKAFESHSTCTHWPQVVHTHWTPREMAPQKLDNVKDEMVRSLIGCDMLTDPKWKYVPDSGGCKLVKINYGDDDAVNLKRDGGHSKTVHTQWPKPKPKK